MTEAPKPVKDIILDDIMRAAAAVHHRRRRTVVVDPHTFQLTQRRSHFERRPRRRLLIWRDRVAFWAYNRLGRYVMKHAAEPRAHRRPVVRLTDPHRVYDETLEEFQARTNFPPGVTFVQSEYVPTGAGLAYIFDPDEMTLPRATIRFTDEDANE